MSAVSAVVAAGGAGTTRLLERVEERMAELSTAHGRLLGDHASSTIAAGGKRLRPLLVALAAGVPVPAEEALVRAAVAVELIHSATLVHDDVLDRSALRRGRPTVFALAGRRAATAVGDLLFSRAFAELAAAGPGAARREPAAGQLARESVRVLAHASAALADGELMQREDLYHSGVSIERYLERCRLKTGVLFRAACELGALVGGGSRAALAAFGEKIGVAFQILDDVLDVSGPPERTGKPRGADLLDGTVTLPLILAGARDAHVGAVDLRAVGDGAAAAELCERIAATGALGQARERALGLVAEAKGLLRGLPAAQRVALELAADGVVERYS